MIETGKDGVYKGEQLEEKRGSAVTSFGVPSRIKNKLETTVAVLMSIYSILYVGHVFDIFGIFIPQLAHLSLFLAFLLTLCFSSLPIRKGKPRENLPWYDVLIILLAIAGPVYNFFTWESNINRYAFHDFYLFEIVFTFTTILAVLEATRRALGLAMPLVAVLFLLHMFFGSYITGFFHVRKFTTADLASAFVYHNTGIYGIPLGTAAIVIVTFIIFSEFMFATGAGDFFIKFGLSLVGHMRGGPAKVSVFSSALIGTFTGATAANIVADGIFTIPMMKRVGYGPEFAAAIETVTSNGGQIMPPVMGLVAFVMAEWLGIPYWNIALISFMPACLYFIAVFIMVDAEAGRLGLRGIPRSECPPVLKTAKQGWIVFSSILAIMFFLGVLMYSPETSVLYALGVLLLLSAIQWVFGAYKRQSITLQGTAHSAVRLGVAGFKGGGISMITPGIACACAGIIIGTLSVTQLGLVFSDVAVKLAGNNQFVLLVLAAVACFILGMGMSSLPCYIMVVIVVAPALLKFGVPPLLTHMFVFWFALTSFLTPPVAIGAYVAAGIAGANPIKTGIAATRLGFCTFTLPFMFVYNPALLLQGSVGEIVSAVAMSLAGIALLSWGLGGYFLRRENLVQSLLLLAGGLLFITMDLRLAGTGLAMGVIAIGWQVRTVLRERAGARPPSG